MGLRWTGLIATSALCIAILLLSAAPSRAAAAQPFRDPMLAPPSLHEKIDVAVGLHILNVASIDEVDQTFTIDGYLFERWKDPRLAFTAENPDDKVRRYNYGEFWIPRVEMINGASPRDRYDTAILVSPDGTVNYSERCKAVLSSKFHLKRFSLRQADPLDRHPSLRQRSGLGEAQPEGSQDLALERT